MDGVLSDDGLTDRTVSRVLEGVTTELVMRCSGLISEDGLDPLFAENTAEIISETIRSLSKPSPESRSYVSVQYGDEPGLSRTGRTRAIQGRHPSESLMAAEVVFGVALPIVMEHAGQSKLSAGNGVVVAQALHHAIWRRFPAGAIAYVETILEKLSMANQTSRKQVSRELHDRVAHGIAAALQRIELSQGDASEIQAVTNRTTLGEAERILQDVLLDVQEIAGVLRLLVGDRRLQEALEEYAADLFPELPRVRVISEGRASEISSAVKEEAFTIALEAIRNARRHAKNARAIDVNLSWTDTSLKIVVMNDGLGFDKHRVRAGAIGIKSMRERAEVIGALLNIESENQRTRVVLVIPLSQ